MTWVNWVKCYVYKSWCHIHIFKSHDKHVVPIGDGWVNRVTLSKLYLLTYISITFFQLKIICSRDLKKKCVHWTAVVFNFWNFGCFASFPDINTTSQPTFPRSLPSSLFLNGHPIASRPLYLYSILIMKPVVSVSITIACSSISLRWYLDGSN